MIKKNFIRLNINDNYFSFGNFFRIIKEESMNTLFVQTNLFEIIFNTDNIADSTVNNYCTGLRPINIRYKSYYQNLEKKYITNENIFIPIIGRIIELLDNTSLDIAALSISKINQNTKLNHVCTRLYSIAKNDSDVSFQLSNQLYNCLESNDLYGFIIKSLNYIILQKKQPIYINENMNDIIEKNIYDTNISLNDIQDFLQVQLNSGIWSLRTFKLLAEKNNPLACFQMASMEYYGIVTGTPRYEKAYEYYLTAAKYNHPVANWAIGYLYYNGHIGNKSKRDLFLAFKYFNKARKLKCSNAFNSLGLIIKDGTIPHIKPNKEKAILMFEKAIELGNIYAYNNLGNIYEKEKNYKKAFEYYTTPANNGESWAANKIGEFYYKGIYVQKDLKKAFEYYTKSSDSTKFTLCPWSNYNLAKYFYENGNAEIGLQADINKAIELLTYVQDDLISATEELLYIYYKLYINSKNKDYLDKVIFYKEKCENNENFNPSLKKEIETMLEKIKKDSLKIDLP